MKSLNWSSSVFKKSKHTTVLALGVMNQQHNVDCIYDHIYFVKFTIIVCIHDAPGGFTVSGQTKGKSGCPICVDGTASVYLPSFRKLVFIRHRRFLKRKHKYHKMKRYFYNTVEKDSAPKWYTRKLSFKMVKSIQVVFEKGIVKGQKRKKTLTSTGMPFKK
jgi:hypothetical protein